MLMDETTAMSEVPGGQLLTPHLCVFGDALLTAKRFALLVDGIIIVENITNFMKAFCCLLTAYYVFNIPYPNQVSTTLEFCQRVFFGINPEKGLKSCCTKKAMTVNKTVLKTMQKLAR